MSAEACTCRAPDCSPRVSEAMPTRYGADPLGHSEHPGHARVARPFNSSDAEPERPFMRSGTTAGEGVRVLAAGVDGRAPRPGGHLGQRLAVEDGEHRVADVDHHVAQGTCRLVDA